MSALVTLPESSIFALPRRDAHQIMRASLYPGAAEESIDMVLGYCKAAGLDPMQKPVHIVPLWDGKAKVLRDVVMPGIGLYRVQAARTGEYAGMSDAEFGPDVTEELDGVLVTYPQWCRVIVRRRLRTGEIVDFPAREFWRENYATKGGKERSIAPNSMWLRRPYGQIAKCAEAQALRKAFPEIGSQPTAEEMEGKSVGEQAAVPVAAEVMPTVHPDRIQALIYALDECATVDELQDVWTGMDKSERKVKAVEAAKDRAKERILAEDVPARSEEPEVWDAEAEQ